jgi:hypothetical protein
MATPLAVATAEVRFPSVVQFRGYPHIHSPYYHYESS